MMEFFKEACAGDVWSAMAPSADRFDPMTAEAWAACAAAVAKPLYFPPPDSPLAPSPVYTPGDGWSKLAELNDEAAALGLNHVIHFGPGAQQEQGGQSSATAITEQVADLILEERRSSIVDSMFVQCDQPILESPVQQKQDSKALGKATSLRRSSRQQAKLSSVPVSMRATHRLIKAFQVVGPNDPIGEEALDAFAKTFGAPLPPEHIKAVRKLTSLDSGAVTAAAAQLAAAQGAESMVNGEA
jgi:hypothetical protein